MNHVEGRPRVAELSNPACPGWHGCRRRGLWRSNPPRGSCLQIVAKQVTSPSCFPSRFALHRVLAVPVSQAVPDIPGVETYRTVSLGLCQVNLLMATKLHVAHAFSEDERAERRQHNACEAGSFQPPTDWAACRADHLVRPCSLVDPRLSAADLRGRRLCASDDEAEKVAVKRE